MPNSKGLEKSLSEEKKEAVYLIQWFTKMLKKIKNTHALIVYTVQADINYSALMVQND